MEVAVLGSPSLISPYGLCGRKATVNAILRAVPDTLSVSKTGLKNTTIIKLVSH